MEGHLDSGVEYSGNEDLVNAEEDLPKAEGDIANAEGNLANTERDLPNAEGDIANAEGDIANAEGDIANAEGDLPNAEEDLPNAEEAEIQPAHALPAHAEEANVDLRQHVPLEPDILVVEGPYVKRISPEPRDRQSASMPPNNHMMTYGQSHYLLMIPGNLNWPKTSFQYLRNSLRYLKRYYQW